MCDLLRVTELPFISSVEQFCFMERMNLLSYGVTEGAKEY